MFEKFSLKKQFISTFLVVLVCSILSVIITSAVTFHLLVNGNIMNLANHHEKNSYIVQTYIQKNGVNVLDESFKDKLEEDTPIKDMEYEIINNDGTIIYGSLNERIIWSKGDLLTKINRYDEFNSNFTRYVPILDNNGELKGGFIVKYPIKVTAKNNYKAIIILVQIIFLGTPFIFIIFYSLIFGSKFAKNINKPLNLLVDASNKIKNNDLDFEIDYQYNNELGHVIESFNSMKRELKTTLNKHWELEQERKDMVSALSHDLKTPLTIIKGHVEMLQDGAYKKPERLERYLSIIDNNTNRAVALVEDLNLLSKLENPDFKLMLTTIDLKEFIDETEMEFRTLSERKGITLIFNKENIPSSEVNLDKLRISQVMGNLFTNSLRFTPEGGTIEINVTKDKSHINFSISDSGEGFNKEDLKHVFEKFYQGDKSRSKEKGHSGLGLYICKTLVEKHGGEIFAYNNEDGGARIEFYLSCY